MKRLLVAGALACLSGLCAVSSAQDIPQVPSAWASYDAGNAALQAKDYASARTQYAAACDLGLTAGCVALGTCLDQGLGGAQDHAKAAALFGDACDEGAAPGCYFLGVMYRDGRGMAKDAGKAKAFLKKACAKDMAMACDAAKAIG